MAGRNLKIIDQQAGKDAPPLPHSIETEQQLLGAILLDNNVFVKVSHFLRAEDFYDPLHREIYEIIEYLIGEDRVATPVTMARHAGEFTMPEGVTANSYLALLAREATTTLNAIDYAKIVKDDSVKRQLWVNTEKLRQQILNPSIESVEILDEHESFISDLRPKSSRAEQFRPFSRAVAAAIGNASTAYEKGGVISGLSTGMDKLDQALGGLNRGDLIILAARPAMGKAQPLTEPVLMRDGTFKMMGSLKVGDELASHDGASSRVVGIFPQGRLAALRVTFSDGRHVDCCADHLWRIYHRHWDKPRVVDTSELQRLLGKKRYQRRLWIDMVSGEFGGAAALPLDPWLVGALLGDGSIQETVRFSTVDAEMLDFLAEAAGPQMKISSYGAPNYRLVRSGGANAKGVSGVLPNPIKVALQSLGLMGRGSFDKFIPQIYLQADRASRLRLLQGLMDTDGWAEAHGSVRFCTISPDLAAGVQALVRSLGGLCSIVEKRTSRQMAYTCRIRHPNAETFFRLSRKQVRAVRGRNATVRLTVESVAPVGEAEMQCIKVSHPDSLYVTGGFTVTHNTALGINMAFTHAKELQERRLDKVKTGVVAVFSLEMPDHQIANRVIAEESRVSSWRVRKGAVGQDEIQRFIEAGQRLENLPIQIDHTGALPINQLVTRVRALKRRVGVEMVIVDYLQLLRGSGSGRNREVNRVQEVTEITTSLKAIAKELDVPVVALSQLSRKVEERDDKRPHLADLRESGSIEQDADVVIFIYRDEYYLKKAEPRPGTEAHNEWTLRMDQAHGRAELIIGKNRHGPEATIHVGYDSALTRFHNDPPETAANSSVPKEKRTRSPALNLSKRATMCNGMLKTLSLVSQIENDSHVGAAPKGTKLVSYPEWRERCAAECLDPGYTEKQAIGLMEKVIPELMTAKLMGRGGSKEAAFVWQISEKK